MTERLFLDANVLFTAAISPKGVSRSLIDLAAVKICVPLASTFAVDEARRNVRVKYPRCEETLEELIEKVGLVPEADRRLVVWAERSLPPKDAPILAAAVAANADVLVTGDRRHFGEFYGTTLEGVVALPPRQALERVLSP